MFYTDNKNKHSSAFWAAFNNWKNASAPNKNKHHKYEWQAEWLGQSAACNYYGCFCIQTNVLKAVYHFLFFPLIKIQMSCGSSALLKQIYLINFWAEPHKRQIQEDDTTPLTV